MSARNWRLTERDSHILEWLSLWRGATSPQIVRALERRYGEAVPLKSVERRVRALRDLGALDSAAILADWPTVHWPTGAGLRAAGVPGPVQPPRVTTLLHDLEVVELYHRLLDQAPERRVVTERQIRLAEGGGTLPLFGPASEYTYTTHLPGGAGRKYPDLASLRPNGNVTLHELERTEKERSRLLRLMRAMLDSRALWACVYWAYPHLLDKVQAAADEANNFDTRNPHQHQRIQVLPWTPHRARASYDS